jgi:hypothetical protein
LVKIRSTKKRNHSRSRFENLPGVGENLQDHVLLSGVVFKCKGKMPDRPADSNAVEAEAYLSSGPSPDTDVSLVLHQLPVVTPEVASPFWCASPGRVHNRACAGAAHPQRFGPPGEQQLSGCRCDRWQLSRNGSSFAAIVRAGCLRSSDTRQGPTGSRRVLLPIAAE